MRKEKRALIQTQGDNLAVAIQSNESDTPHLPVKDFKELKEIYPAECYG